MSRFDDLKKQNPQLDISLIDILASLDPSATNKYLGFMIKLIKNELVGKDEKDYKKIFAQALFDEEFIDYIRRFENHCVANRVKNPDISGYKSIDDVIHEVGVADQILKQKESEKQVIKLLDDKDYLVLVPLSFEASKTYGSNTKWCVTQDTHWNSYQWKYKLIYIIDKKSNIKYAISKNYGDNRIQGWLADDSERSPFMFKLPGSVMSIITDELNTDMYSTEMNSLNESAILTKEGHVISLERTDKNDLRAFMKQFGNYLSNSFKQKIKIRFNEIGLDPNEFKECFNNLKSEKNNGKSDLVSQISKF